MQNSHKIWQVEAQGKIYEAEYDELKQWIAEGAVSASDKVKRGNLRWVAVGLVPELSAAVNSDVSTADFPPIEEDAALESSDFHVSIAQTAAISEFCSSHAETRAAFVCDICKKSFCKICPRSFGGTVKLCPVCSSLCRAVDEPAKTLDAAAVGAINKPYSKIEKKKIGFGRRNFNRLQNSSFAAFLLSILKKLYHSV